MRRLIRHGVLSVSALCAMGCVGCGGARHDAEIVDARVQLLPGLAPGDSGWCLVTAREAAAGEGCGWTRAGDPIVAQRLDAGAPPPETTGIDLTRADVAALSVEGTRIPTRDEPGLPQGFRAVMWRLPGVDPQTAPVPPRVAPLNKRGVLLRQSLRTSAAGLPVQPLLVQYPTRPIGLRATARQTPCAISAAAESGLDTRGGAVVTTLAARPTSVGEGFTACVAMEYSLDGWPMSATMLVSAAAPWGSAPPLPGMRALNPSAGIFTAPGPEGPELVRRFGGAWIVVTKGRDQQQRVALLRDLRPTREKQSTRSPHSHSSRASKASPTATY